MSYLKRSFDLVLALALIPVLAPLLLTVALAVRYTSPGPVLYWSDRIGRSNRPFRMPKFRTMRVETPAVATHLLTNPASYLTGIGSYLRRYSLDELPQLFSILKGDMSFVGPRPALFNQKDLIRLRTQAGVHTLRPGLSGWAQINGRDDLSITVKVKFDLEYLRRRSLSFDLYIICITLVKAFHCEDVSH